MGTAYTPLSSSFEFVVAVSEKKGENAFYRDSVVTIVPVRHGALVSFPVLRSLPPGLLCPSTSHPAHPQCDLVRVDLPVAASVNQDLPN